MATSTSLPTTSYAVLGLLSLAPMSGYELVQSAERSIANFWPIAKSQVYGELRRLEELGYVSAEDVAQQKRPDKRVFELTADGRRVLDQWLAAADWERDRTRQAFLVKVFFGHRMEPADFLALVERYREEAEEQREYLQGVVEVLGAVSESFYARSTALLGLRVAEATLAWVTEVTEQMVDLRDRLEAHPHDVAETTRQLFAAIPGREQP